MSALVRDEQRIEHIWHAITRILDVVAGVDYERFKSSEAIQEQLFYNLMVLGEASNRLSKEFREAHADIPWAKIIGMRNVLIHDYSDVDYEIAWAVVNGDIQNLRDQIKPIFDALPPAASISEAVELI